MVKQSSVLDMVSKSGHLGVNLTNLVDLGDATRQDPDMVSDLTHAIEKAFEA